MRIISNKLNYMLTDVRGEEVDYIAGVRGQTQRVVVRPALHLQFRTFDSSRRDEYEAALAFWNQGNRRDPSDPWGYEAWGSHPGVMSEPVAHPSSGERMLTHAWTPMDTLSVFDTEWLSPEDKQYVEDFFRSGKFSSGGDCFIYEAPKMVAPWPAYDKIGQGAAAKIPSVTRDMGLDPRIVYRYEAANKAREGVLAAVQKLIDEDAQGAAIDRALEVQL